MLEKIANLMFPPMCLGCGRVGEFICYQCKGRRLYRYNTQYCHVCRGTTRKYLVHNDCKTFSYLNGVIVGYVLDEFSEKLIHQLKYDFSWQLADLVAELMLERIREQEVPDVDVISWVPMTNQRKRWRGFNQAELIAKRLSSARKIPVKRLLSKTSGGMASQVGSDLYDRKASISEKFKCIEDLEGMNVIVVDDVFTTGATLEEIARILKGSGVSSVYGWVFARGA